VLEEGDEEADVDGKSMGPGVNNVDGSWQQGHGPWVQH
jgi:hypothetical protein